MSRFLGKIGLEILTSRVLNVPNWNSQLVDNSALDELRDYVRFNEGTPNWPFSFRTLYPVNAVFQEVGETYQVLHEYDLLRTETDELYAIVAIHGVEFGINLGGPVLEGYMNWLRQNGEQSPLYLDVDPQVETQQS